MRVESGELQRNTTRAVPSPTPIGQRHPPKNPGDLRGFASIRGDFARRCEQVHTLAGGGHLYRPGLRKQQCPETWMLPQAPARKPDATARRTSMAPADLVLRVRGPDYEDLVRHAQAARATAMTALVRQVVAEIVARLHRPKDRVSSAIGARIVSSQP